MLTFGDIKRSTIVNVARSAPASDAFRALINDALDRLVMRGDWANTVFPMYVCVNSSCITWPRYVKTVRNINVCRHKVEVSNGWYDFLVRNGSGMWGNWRGEECHMTNQFRTPVHTDIQGDGRYLRIYPTVKGDAGKTVTIFGVDNNGQPLQTKVSDTLYQDGLTLGINWPYSQSSIPIRRIDRVLKDVTINAIRLYAYNASTTLLEDVAYYEASETSPNYLRSRLERLGAPGGCSVGVLAMVKLAFIPVQNDADLVLIDNLGAIKTMVQSLKYEEAGDVEASAKFEMKALRELNRQLENESPDEQVTITRDPFAGTCIGRQQTY